MSKNLKLAEGRKLYLAYGSNLAVDNMHKRCPTAKPVKSLTLRDVRLAFRGVADLEYEPGAKTPAGLWDIGAEDEAALDFYEGVAVGNYHKLYFPVGKKQKALVYLMRDRYGIFPPSAYYAAILRRGYRNFALDPAYLDAAIRHSFDRKSPSEQTIARRKRQKNSTHQHQLVRFPEELAVERTEATREWDNAAWQERQVRSTTRSRLCEDCGMRRAGPPMYICAKCAEWRAVTGNMEVQNGR